MNPSHGTSTGSVLVSDIGPNGIDHVTGAAPKAKIIPLCTNDSVVYFSYLRLCRALYFAADKGWRQRLTSLFSLRGARVTISRINDDDTIVRAAITYKTSQWERLEPKLEIESSGSTYTARFRSGLRALPYTNANTEEWDTAIGNYDVATDLSITCSSVNAAMNLRGLPLTQCTFRVRQGTLEVDFDAPTNSPVEKFTVSGYALNLSIANIGNTDFGSFELTGLGGTADLDFEGFYQAQQHSARIVTTGMILNITVPSDAWEQVGVLPLSLPVVVVPRSEWKRDLLLPFFYRYSTNDYNTQNIKIDMGITSIGSFGMVVRV